MEIDEAAHAFTALGQPTRLTLLRTLLAAPDGMAAGDVAARLGVPPSTLSFHLKALEQAGLIAAARQGRSLVYGARPGRLEALLGFLAPQAKAGGAVFNVLFLCTHNAARSIMAEAILGDLGAGRFQAFSAGSAPSPAGPLPEVLGHLKALGHAVAGLRSKPWDEFTGPAAPRMDFVIALCDTLAGQTCPDFGDTSLTAAWPLPDPAKFTGNAAERATLLNELYAALHRRLGIFASLPFGTLDRLALKARLDDLARPWRPLETQ